MSTEEAIQILDQVTAQIPLVRADQAKVLQALQTLRDVTDKGIHTLREQEALSQDKYEQLHATIKE